MNQDIEWMQDTFSVTIKVPIKRTTKSKIQVTAYSNFIKISHQERNYLRMIDCFDRIRCESLNWNYSENCAVISFQKEIPRMWDSFETIGKSKLEIRNMRKEAIQEKELADHKRTEELQNLKGDLSKEAYDQRLQLDKDIRNKAETLRQQEKDQALNYILGDHSMSQSPLSQKTLYSNEKPRDNVTSSIENSTKDNQKLDMKTDPSLFEILCAKESQEVLVDSASTTTHGPVLLLSRHEIDAMKSRVNTLSRSDSSAFKRPQTMEPIQLNFTQRVFPTLAMREQHLLQAPISKSSKPNEKVEGMSYQSLKERADNFMRNQDYQAATIAYEESLKLKPDAIRTLLNFAALNIKLLKIQAAENLLDRFEQAYSAFDEIAKAIKENQNLQLNAKKKRACVESLKGNYNDALAILKDLSNKADTNSDTLGRDITVLEKRIRSETIKVKADDLILECKYAEAVIKYEEALHVDPINEKVLGNIAFAYSKLNENEKSIEYIQKCLDQVNVASQYFDLKSTSISKNSPLFKFVLKSLLRKSEFLESMGDIDQAELAVRECRKLDENNKAAIDRMKRVRRSRNLIEFESMKNTYTKQIQANNFAEALETINKAEMLLDFDLDVIDLLKNSLNKISCYLQMGRNNEVVTECIRGLKILTNLTNNAIDKRKVELRDIYKSEIKEMHVRFLLRRSSALGRMGQIFNAKKDLEGVLEIDANHIEAKKSLEIFRLSSE